jgi:hypothetical protein
MNKYQLLYLLVLAVIALFVFPHMGQYSKLIFTIVATVVFIADMHLHIKYRNNPDTFYL